jgi:cell wall-associated NlpC family hydrolase
MRERPVSALARFVPLLAALLISACHTVPPQQPDPAPAPVVVDQPEPWDGSGGAPAMRNRGEALANFALTLRGTPYRYGGASPGGFDCSGLVFFAHQRFGVVVPRTSSDQADEAEGIKPRKLRRGDLVFFRIGSKRVNHVGIYIGDRRFVHAPGAGKPVTINSLDDEFYSQRFYSAGRYWDRLPRR